MKYIKRLAAAVVMVALLALPFVIYFNAQALTDWRRLRGYVPPANVVKLADQNTMTSQARHDFYVNQPNIESNASQFRTDCGETEKTIVLGCYHGNQAGIFIYNVTDPRLAGVQQVTAAHEMLHAAYDRLNSNDKNQVNDLLQTFFDKQLKDQRVIDTINAYRQSEPNDLVNEMHSIFGTEVADLPAPLEKYYSRYFTDRHVVTDFAAAYQKEFTAREDLIKSYGAQLSSMKVSINSEEQLLQSQLGQINLDRAQLDRERASGQIDKYNANIPGFNREINQYNSGVAKLREDISAYNQLVDKYNDTARELASLQQAIDTRLTAQAAQ